MRLSEVLRKSQAILKTLCADFKDTRPVAWQKFHGKSRVARKHDSKEKQYANDNTLHQGKRLDFDPG